MDSEDKLLKLSTLLQMIMLIDRLKGYPTKLEWDEIIRQVTEALKSINSIDIDDYE